jgi:hypothetical protein
MSGRLLFLEIAISDVARKRRGGSDGNLGWRREKRRMLRPLRLIKGLLQRTNFERIWVGKRDEGWRKNVVDQISIHASLCWDAKNRRHRLVSE